MSSLQVDSISSMGGGHVDGAGRVLQVVQEELTGEYLTTAGSYQDTGLSGTITPSSSSSKILISINPQAYGEIIGNYFFMMDARITRNGSLLKEFERCLMSAGGTTSANLLGLGGQIYMEYLDNPLSTSALTYELQIAAKGDSGNVRLNKDNEGVSLIKLMEIAQ